MNNRRGTSGQNVQRSKLRQDKEKARPSDRLRHNDDLPPGDDAAPKADKKAKRDDKKLKKSKLRMEKSGDKLDAARDKLKNAKPPKRPGVVKTVGRAARVEAGRYVHKKIYQIEDENVGIKVAHRTELAGESAVRGVSRFVKHRIRTRPTRRVRKWERRDIKARADHTFRTLAQEHPELKKNAVSRYTQKRRIKKQYQKQAREAAKKAAKKTGEKTASAVEKIGRAAVKFVKRHPVGSLILALCFLLIVTLQSCMSMLMSLGNGTTGAVGASTYPSEDAEMLAAEAAYAGMEADLQYELDNYASLHQGYDEYYFDLDPIEHDPYVLISILSALHDGAWTLDEVQGVLDMLFYQQYILTETVVVEVRYRTEYWSYTDPETGESSGGSYEVPYDYYICYVTLENYNLSHLPIYIMSEDQLSRYALYMTTLGNRPDLFPTSAYPYASTNRDYERYAIPPEYFGDEVFAAMIAEAEKYLGFPYVWGGYSPATSFDCSGFVSWVINHSGWNVGRLGASGLYNICTPIPASSAKPGDLVFFIGTYDAPDPNAPTHVGIYVGDGMMIHAGDPISYTSINTAYWQNHLYAYGRLP